MRCVACSLAWNRPEFEQRLRELFRVQGRIEKRDIFECLQPSAGSIYIAHSGFCDNKCRCDEFEPGRRVTPPCARYLLIRCDHDIP